MCVLTEATIWAAKGHYGVVLDGHHCSIAGGTFHTLGGEGGTGEADVLYCIMLHDKKAENLH